MKKRWIPFLILCLMVGFLLGLQNGSAAEADRLQTRQEIQIFTQTAIAVVNADVGAAIDGVKQNYSAAIIETLGADFTLVGLAMANNGFENGSYGAVVIFPSDVSSKILSFNSKQPEKVQLEFKVSPNLSEKDYLKVYVKILELQLSINTTLAYTYVSSIYTQFQHAQDQVGGIFQNDQSDLSALDVVKLKDFTASLDLEELPDIPLETAPADTESYFLDVTGFADDVSRRYLDSYGMASSQYLWMRDGLFRLSDNFPQQEDDWLNDLSDWTTISVDYGQALEEYSAAVLEHEEELIAWYLENVEWNEALKEYQADVMDWFETLQIWYGDAEDWYVEYQDYLEKAQDYVSEVELLQLDLMNSTGDVLDAMTAWKDALDSYVGRLLTFYGDMSGKTGDISTWYTDAVAQEILLSGRQADLETWQGALDTWQSDLDTWHGALEGISNGLAADIAASPMPQKPDPTDPVYVSDPIQYDTDLNNWYIAIQIWYDTLKNVSDGLQNDLASPSLTPPTPPMSPMPLTPLPTLDPIPSLPGLPDLDPDNPVDPDNPNPPLLKPPPEYEGGTITDEKAGEWSAGFEELDIPRAEMELDPPPDYDGSEEPAEVEEIDPMEAEQPEDPLVDPPPRPDDFWASLNSMHDQLSSFDVGEYLSDDIKQQVALLLNAYEAYLGTVRDDLSIQFDFNILKLLDVQSGYSSYLSDVKVGALKAEADEQDNLKGTLEEYAAVKEQNSEDTQQRLYSFANMMPESRSPAGLNRNLVGFTVAPFEFMPPALRPEKEVVPTVQIPMTDTYRGYLWIVLWVACGVLALTLASYILTYRIRKRRQEAE